MDRNLCLSLGLKLRETRQAEVKEEAWQGACTHNLSEQREDWLEMPPVLYIKHKQEEKWHGNYTNRLQGEREIKEKSSKRYNEPGLKEQNDTPGKCFEI